MTTKVMQGVRVLEVAQFTFVPAAGGILADWGADVIKVEHPVRGDTQRGFINMGGVQLDPQLAGTVGQAVFVLPNSRENEQEADVIGVELMARAGYDPRAALSLWQKMGQLAGSGGPPEFLSTHPSSATRLRELQAYVDKVMPLYQAAKR